MAESTENPKERRTQEEEQEEQEMEEELVLTMGGTESHLLSVLHAAFIFPLMKCALSGSLI